MPCVLIVEDDADVLEMMDILMTSHGYETMRAGNGLEALDQLRERRPCLILLDLQMPVMDGFDFRRHQLADPALASIPVLCITAMFDTDEVARKLGLRCLPKAGNFDQVVGEVRSLCGPGVSRDAASAGLARTD